MIILSGRKTKNKPYKKIPHARTLVRLWEKFYHGVFYFAIEILTIF